MRVDGTGLISPKSNLFKKKKKRRRRAEYSRYFLYQVPLFVTHNNIRRK
jgi:hypothetical protein